MKKYLCCLLLWVCVPLAWAKPPVPSLWKVSDADNSIYLLGSFHMLKPGDYPLAPNVEAAFADSAKVVFEVAPSEDELADSMLFMQAGTQKNGKTLQETLSRKTWKALQVYGERNQFPVQTLQQFKPWMAGMLIQIHEAQKQGLEPKLGLDLHFMQRAKKAGKTTAGLETFQSQIELFDAMDAPVQEQMLQEGLDGVRQSKVFLDKLHAAWRQGDDKTLLRLGLQDWVKQYPQLYKSIMVDRNNAWLPQLQALLADNTQGNTLVIVGALHLLGDDGLLKRLSAQGFRVQRLR